MSVPIVALVVGLIVGTFGYVFGRILHESVWPKVRDWWISEREKEERAFLNPNNLKALIDSAEAEVRREDDLDPVVDLLVESVRKLMLLNLAMLLLLCVMSFLLASVPWVMQATSYKKFTLGMFIPMLFVLLLSLAGQGMLSRTWRARKMTLDYRNRRKAKMRGHIREWQSLLDRQAKSANEPAVEQPGDSKTAEELGS